MRGNNCRETMDRHGWLDIEIASLDYLFDQRVEITTRGEMAMATESGSEG